MITADFNTGAPLKTYEIRSAKMQAVAPDTLHDVFGGTYLTGERICFLKTDDINLAVKGFKFEYEATEIGATIEVREAPQINATQGKRLLMALIECTGAMPSNPQRQAALDLIDEFRIKR